MPVTPFGAQANTLVRPVMAVPAQSAAPSVAKQAGAPIILAQAGDPRVPELEEQLRQLNGRVEELNFQVLQMQDLLRRMQEDNEFRFKELEEKRSDTGTKPAPERKAEASEAPPAGGETSTTQTRTGEPPRTLGSVLFDADGNVIGGETNGDPVDLVGEQNGGASTDGTAVAALPEADSANELYRNAYEFILSGDYKTAEAGFRQHIERYPDDSQAADANFWLGEALLGQDRYQDAAEVFLRANRNFPDAKKAPDMLLKLGVSLAALDQRDVACATFNEIGKKYPNASAALQERVKKEQASTAC